MLDRRAVRTIQTAITQAGHAHYADDSRVGAVACTRVQSNPPGAKTCQQCIA